MKQSGSNSCVLSVIKLLVMVVLVGSVVFASFFAGMVFQRRQSPLVESAGAVVPPVILPTATAATAPGFDVFWEAWNIVQNEFYQDIPSAQDRMYGAIRGMVSTFGDDHTAFIEPTRAALLQQDASGSFEGIGAAVRIDDLGRLIIAEPFAGRPAAEAGLLRGDIILKIDGQETQSLSLYESVLLIRGQAGTSVTLTLIREGEPDPFEVSVIRARIEIEVVTSKMLDGNVGYVSLSEFSNGASEKMKTAIKELRDQGATSLVIDLRDNPGGFLSEAVAVSSLFMKDSVVLLERRKGEAEDQIFKATGTHVATDLPLVVLVNRGSASASEIVAGAIKDNKRGTIIGEQSFGKGTVQLPHTLSDGSELRVTIAQWLTPNGNFIHKQGIVPDVVVERTQEDYLADRDPQLDKAVEYLLK